MDLDYAAELPDALIELVEHHARALGLPLAALEAVGSSLEAAEAFVVAAEEGRGLEVGFRWIDREPPEDARHLELGAHPTVTETPLPHRMRFAD